MHTTYLIVEKQNKSFNLYWANRPTISRKPALDATATLTQIRSMLDERFPFMDIVKLMNYPVQSKKPKFSGSDNFANTMNQGNRTNCVVSNMFSTLEVLDLLRGEERMVTDTRYKVVRKSLIKNYDFYKNEFFPFADEADGYSLRTIWSNITSYPDAPI